MTQIILVMCLKGGNESPDPGRVLPGKDAKGDLKVSGEKEWRKDVL